MTARPMTPLEWTLLVALSVIWGGSFFLNEIALSELPVLSVVAGRVGIAALALWLVLRGTGGTLPRRAWGPCLVMGLANNALPFGLIVWGQVHIESSAAAILNATTPLFALAIAHVSTRDERMTPAKLAGLALGVAGVAVMLGGTALAESGAALAGQAAILGAALSYGASGVYGRRFGPAGIGPLAVATGQVTAAALILVPLALVVDGVPAPATVPSMSAVIGLALVCTALAYLIYFRLLATAGAVNLLLVTILVPVSATALGLAFLGEVVGPRHLAGLALIGAGLLTIDGRIPARVRAIARG